MKLVYRPEIDGLRAIAVAAVILYHAQITIFGHQPFKGGFIGVDIFFVISGYLITSIIFKELISTGSFSFKYFYERRIRRILPLLLLVMFVSCCVAYVLFSPKRFVDFSNSILYSIGFTSNFYFHYSGQQYGALSGLFKPFLHTWSLSVEEQYYILFPVILLFVFKFFKKYLFTILVFGFITSLLMAEWGSRNNSSATFYFLHTRMWELLAGSILAYFEITFGHRSKYKILNFIFPSIGLLLIGLSILFFNDKIFHPSFYTLSPVVGACLIIWFSSKDELITKILSSKLFVGTGLISYSLYLWNYPIFAFSRITDFVDGNIWLKFFFGIVIVLLSIISYYFVERPARNKDYNFKKIFLIIASISFLLILFNTVVLLTKGFESRFKFSDNNYHLSQNIDSQESIKFEISYNYDDYDNRRNVLIVGNSHGDDVLKILSKTKLANNIYFNTPSPKVKKSDCNFQVRYFYRFLTENKTIMDECNDDFLNHLKKQYRKSELIIIATQYHENDLDILDQLIKIIKKNNKKIIVFNNALEQSTKKGLLNRLDYFVFKNTKFPDMKQLKKIEEQMYEDLKNKEKINVKIKMIANKNKIPLIEREKIFCDIMKKRCPSITEDGFKIYWDKYHVTGKGADYLAKKIEQNQIFLEYLNSSLQK